MAKLGMDSLKNMPMTTSPAPDARATAIQAFYTRSADKGDPVRLFVNQVSTQGRPDFDGVIGGRRVVVWIRRHQGKKFLSIYGNRKDETGMLPPLGTARLVVTDRGIPKLAIRMDVNKNSEHEVIWATASIKLDIKILVAAGLDLKVLALRKQAAAEAQVIKQQENQTLVPAAEQSGITEDFL